MDNKPYSDARWHGNLVPRVISRRTPYDLTEDQKKRDQEFLDSINMD